MADEDLSDFIDAGALARLLASPKFDVEACRERIAAYLREGDGNAGRGIEEISRERKAHAGDQLRDLKPALIAQLAYTKHGVFSSAVGHRSHGALGHAIWHTYDSTRLLDASPFVIADLMQVLHPHADGEIDRVARDLVTWVELGDEAARERLTPVVERAGVFELREVGYTTATGARILDVLTLALPDLEAKLDRILGNTAAQISHGSHLASLAVFLETHEGPSDAPAWESDLYANADDRAYARAVFEVCWRLVRRHRALFDRHASVFAKNIRSDQALHLLGIIDEETELSKTGARGEPWRIMRAGRLVMTTTGATLHYLPKFTISTAATEAAARKSYAKKLAAKQTS